MAEQSSSPSSNKSHYASLAPSQAIGSRKRSTGDGNGADKSVTSTPSSQSQQQQPQPQPQPQPQQPADKAPKKRRPRKKAGKKSDEPSSLTGVGDDARSNTATSGPGGASETGDQNKASTNRQRNRARSNKKKGNPNGGGQAMSNEAEAEDASTSGGAPAPQRQQPAQTKNKKKNNNNNRKRKKYPWRRSIPQGTVDPITLENLVSLEYPPFALVANAPYEPVPVWPIPKQDEKPQNATPKVNIEELNRQRLVEHWGSSIVKDDTGKAAAPPLDPEKRHYNLYDGRALAYYIVSQLQFIDPLNRRDLTREELLTLDAYLKRHGFQDLKVTDAYDAKGITISSAGAAAATAQGRADILQQMASNLLNALFGGQSVASTPPTPRQETTLQEQYAALRVQEESQTRQRQQRQTQTGLNPNASPYGNGVVYTSEDGGLMIIDDDENPGLRGGDYTASRANGASSDYSATNGPGSFNSYYSANHIAARYGSGMTAAAGSDAFPALPTPSPVGTVAVLPSTKQEPPQSSKPAGKPSKTLSRITGAIKKTNPEDQQRQWEARETARKRAMMANMSFGVDASIMQKQQLGLLQPPPGILAEPSNFEVSSEKLERNKAFADALGVKPATLRQSINAGWTRPTEPQNILDEFGTELNATIYPDALIVQARDRMGLLLKLEKKWKLFLKDDKAASMPLNPMDKPARAFVHHYSDCWNLKTESFDPQPRRYIHCVKMLDTHMPYPLLSDAARNWRGPTLPIRPAMVVSSDKDQQAAGQPSKSREIPPPPERVPLSLQPRSLAPGEQKADPVRTVATTATFFGDGGDTSNSRFGALFEGRERPKIEVAQRTVPLELPPFQATENAHGLQADRQERLAKQEERSRRERASEERKRQALEDAFASDKDEDVADHQSVGSEWDEPEVVYQGSDSEE